MGIIWNKALLVQFLTQNSPAKSKRAAPKIDTYLPQVETLSDKELSEQLQEHGESVGPITATTRTVYERKLAKLMATEGTINHFLY